MLKTFQNRRVSSPAPVTMASPSGDMAYRRDIRALAIFQLQQAALAPRQETLKLVWYGGPVPCGVRSSRWDSPLPKLWVVSGGFYYGSRKARLMLTFPARPATWSPRMLTATVANTHQVEDTIRVASELGHLCKGRVLPHEDLVL